MDGMDTHEATMKGVHRRSYPLVGILVAVLAIPLASSCASHRRQVVASTETVTAVEQRAVTPPRMIDVSIVNLHDEPTNDPDAERVVGTVVNQGDRPVERIAIRIEALDDGGNVVRSVTTPPLEHPVDAYGGTATFETVMPVDRVVAGYHAVAIAQ